MTGTKRIIMTGKAYNLVLLADYIIGAFFAFCVFAFAATAFAATGSAINSRQAQAIGNVYANVLMRVEDGARALRADYCARGKVRSGAMCGDPNLLLGAPSASAH